jgi:alpha-tubulin suppressor-like RCC1 family protein
MHPKSAFRGTALLSLVVVALSSGCGDSTAPNDGPAEIAITAIDTLRSVGATATLTAVVRNVSHEVMPGVPVSWVSSNPTIATVIATTGLVTAVANGSATITARAGTITSSTKAVVLQAPASITLVPPLDTLRSLGETGQYTAVVKDAGGSTIAAPVVRWTSTNSAVVAVDMVQGVVTAVSNGAVYVQARSGSVVDSLPLAVRQRIDPTKSPITLTRPLLFIDDTVRATLQVRDARSNAITTGGSTVVFSSTGSAGSSSLTFLPTLDNGDGTYNANLIGSGMGSPRTVTANIDGLPVSVTPTVRVVGFTKIAAAGATLHGAVTTTGGFTCGIITTGDMYCWGVTWFGVRGNGSLGTLSPGPTATLVAGGRQWTDVAAGRWYVCAAASGGGGYCWGSGGAGELGNGISGHGSDDNVSIPTPISGGSTIETVSIGGLNGGCAVTLTKTAMCWGAGVWGRLGNGSETDTNVPVVVSGGLSFDALSTSFSGTCGISAGSAYCWGIYSILGLGASPAPESCSPSVACSKTPFAVSGGRVFRPMVAVDGNVACALGTDDKVYCWGAGYVGTGSMGAGTPTPVSGGLSFTSLGTAGDGGHCGIAVGGAAHCWGVNSNGRFGNGTTSDATVPTAVSGGHAFTQLSMSLDHMCGVAADGNAYCSGGNDMGELGDRTTTRSLTPVRVKLFAP